MKQLILAITILFMFFGCSQKEPKLLQHIQQTNHLVQNIAPLHVDIENFNSRVFMPWSINSIKISNKRAAWANFVYARKDRYYAENTLLWDEKEVKSIIKNTNFKRYNQDIAYAITTKDIQKRNLPSFKPFFRSFAQAGEGYPFDYMQNTRLHINTPLLISHYSLDGAWAFVQSPVSTGWLPRDSFALIDAKRRAEFKRAKKLVITKDNLAIYDKNQEYLLHAKLGSQFAITKENDDFFHSYMYTRFSEKKELRIPKSKSAQIPLEFNEQNILQISSELLGEKYGWGGYSKNRDCSSMTKDFFAPFGLWLPRNSAAQKNAGDYISIKGLSNEEKEKMILKHGIAFLSIIYLKGHIMLYAGQVDNKAAVMHNMWGIKTEKYGTMGRHVIGKAVISDLYLGEELSGVKDSALLISRVEGITIKPNVSSFKQNKFVRFYPSITKLQDNILYFEDNSTLKYHDFLEKTFEEMIDNPSIKDTLSQPYEAFSPIVAPTYDAGRFRNEDLLKKLYGENIKEIQQNLVLVEWVDGSKILFNSKQNAAKQLSKVIIKLKELPKKYDKFLSPIAGAFNYRKILDTSRLSSHSFGVAIDLSVAQSSYWKWDKTYNFRNETPKTIVDIFEAHGFIWGGRWHHYDTMHFEYRPELFETID